MPTTGIINGKLIRLYDDTNVIGQSTECTLDISTQMRSISHKDSGGFQENLPGEISGTLTVNNFLSWDATHGYKELVAKQLAGTAITWKMSTEVSGDFFLSGTAYINQSGISAPNEENSTANISLTVTGTISTGTVA